MQTKSKGCNTKNTTITMKKTNKRIALNNNKQDEETDSVSEFRDDEGYDAAESIDKKALPSSYHRGLGWPFRKVIRGDAMITLTATAPVGSIEIPAITTTTTTKNNTTSPRCPSTRRRSSHTSHEDSSRGEKSSSKTQHYGGGGSITASAEEALNHLHHTILLVREDANSIVDDTREDVAVISIASGGEERDEFYVSDNDGNTADNTNPQHQPRYRRSNETQKRTRRRAAVDGAGEIRKDLTCGLEGEASLVGCCGGAKQPPCDTSTTSTVHEQKQYSKSVSAVLSTWLLDPGELCCSMLTGMLVGEGQQKVCLHCLQPVNLFTQKASVRKGYPYADRRHRDQYLHQNGCEAERTHTEILMNDVLDELEEAIFYFLRRGEEEIGGSERARSRRNTTTRIVAYEAPKSNVLLRAASPQRKWGQAIQTSSFRGVRKDDSYYTSSRRMRGSTGAYRRSRRTR